MYDLAKWFVMPLKAAGNKLPNGQVYGRDTHHLEGMNLTNNTKVYAYHYDTGKTLIFGKTPNGYPWDLKSYDSQFIYDTGTELDWSSPKDFKMMNTPVKMCPRYWDGDPTSYQFSQHAAYGEYKNCAQIGNGDVGPVYYTLQGPFSYDYQGTVGQQPTLLLTYYWTDKKNREQLFLTPTFGWVRWTHAGLVQLSANTSDYVFDSIVVHNQVVPGVVPYQFPCSQLA